MASCPAGHESATTDYCDECGVPMNGSPLSAAPEVSAASVPPATHEAPAGDACPVCGTATSGRFCEECGHDLRSAASSGPAPTPAPTLAPTPAPTPAAAASASWVAIVVADRAHYDTVLVREGGSEVPFPPYCPERRIPLVGPEVRIGRRSVSRGVTPEIDLAGPPTDPGISHLHAVLLRTGDDTWQLVDPGSTNGTTLNDAPEELEANVAVAVTEGDRIHVGAWTTITLRREAS